MLDQEFNRQITRQINKRKRKPWVVLSSIIANLMVMIMLMPTLTKAIRYDGEQTAGWNKKQCDSPQLYIGDYAKDDVQNYWRSFVKYGHVLKGTSSLREEHGDYYYSCTLNYFDSDPAPGYQKVCFCMVDAIETALLDPITSFPTDNCNNASFLENQSLQGTKKTIQIMPGLFPSDRVLFTGTEIRSFFRTNYCDANFANCSTCPPKNFEVTYQNPNTSIWLIEEREVWDYLGFMFNDTSYYSRLNESRFGVFYESFDIKHKNTGSYSNLGNRTVSFGVYIDVSLSQKPLCLMQSPNNLNWNTNAFMSSASSPVIELTGTNQQFFGYDGSSYPTVGHFQLSFNQTYNSICNFTYEIIDASSNDIVLNINNNQLQDSQTDSVTMKLNNFPTTLTSYTFRLRLTNWDGNSDGSVNQTSDLFTLIVQNHTFCQSRLNSIKNNNSILKHFNYSTEVWRNADRSNPNVTTLLNEFIDAHLTSIIGTECKLTSVVLRDLQNNNEVLKNETIDLESPPSINYMQSSQFAINNNSIKLNVSKESEGFHQSLQFMFVDEDDNDLNIVIDLFVCGKNYYSNTCLKDCRDAPMNGSVTFVSVADNTAEDKKFNVRDWLNSNYTHCPIDSYLLTDTQNIELEASAEIKQIFIVDSVDKEQLVLNKQVTSGNFLFKLKVLYTDVLEQHILMEEGPSDYNYASFDMNITLKPCGAGFAQITPSSVAIEQYLASETSQLVKLELNMSSITDTSTNWTTFKTLLQFPIFTNNDDTLCPLTYSIKRGDNSQAEVEAWETSLNDTGFYVEVPMTYYAEAHNSFRIEAANPSGIKNTSALVEVKQTGLCISIMDSIMSQDTISKDLSYTTYVWENSNINSPNVTSVLKDFLLNSPLKDIGSGNNYCPVVKIQTAVNQSNLTGSTANLTANVTFDDSQNGSSLALNVNNEGWNDTLQFAIIDSVGLNVTLNIHLYVCGFDFNNSVDCPIYDCRRKLDQLKTSINYSRFVDDSPQELDKDIESLVVSNDEICPVTSLKIKRENSLNGADSNSTEVANFYTKSGNTEFFFLKPINPGHYKFYLFVSNKIESKMVEVNLNYKPCGSGIAQIAPSDVSSSHYFIEEDGGAQKFEIKLDNVDWNSVNYTAQTTPLKLPKFNNNDDVECPLTYTLEARAGETELVENWPIESNDDGINIQVPIHFTENHTYKFKVVATNPASQTSSLKIELLSSQLCESLLEKIQNNDSISKVLRFSAYVWEIDLDDVFKPLETQIFKEFFTSNRLDNLTAQDCAYYSNFTLEKETSRNSTLDANFVGLTQNVTLKEVPTSLLDSSLYLDVSSEGWNDTINFQIFDLQGKSLTLIVKLAVCGDDFQDTTMCHKTEFCRNKTIFTQNENMTVNLDVDQVPDTYQTFNFSEWFTTNYTECPILRFHAKLENDVNGSAPNETLSAIYSLPSNKEGVLNVSLAEGGIHYFYLFGLTRKLYSSIYTRLNIRPCRLGVAQITPPYSFDGLPYFMMSENKFIVTKDLLQPTDQTTTNMSLPVFTNNDDELCPLTYTLVPKDQEMMEPASWELTVNSTVDFQLPLFMQESHTYTFYQVATNPDQVEARTDLITIEAPALCDSKLALLQTDDAVVKDIDIVLYVWQIPNREPLLKTDALSNYLNENSLTSLNDSECMLMDPFIQVESTDQSDTNDGGQMYEVSDNIKLKVLPKSIGNSSILVNVSSEGWSETINLSVLDIKNNTLEVTVNVYLCGDDFNDPEICVEEKPDIPLVDFKPTFTSDYLGGLQVEDLWSVFEANPEDGSLQLAYFLGKVDDTDSEELDVKFDMESDYQSIFTVTITDLDVNLNINMAEFYKSSLMAEPQDINTEIQIIAKDLSNEVTFIIPVTFAAKPAPPQEETKNETEKVEPDVEEIEQSEVVKAAFNFEAIPERKAENKPVSVASATEDKTERTSPQMSKIELTITGEVTIVFSKEMRYPQNWVKKYISDAQVSSVEEKLVDSIKVPILGFLYEVAEQEPPYEQIVLPDKDVKIIALSDTSITFKVSFDSLEDPASISLTSATQQDLLIVKIPKKLVINSQDGVSLVLDSADFSEEDGENFYSSVSLQPQFVEPKATTTKTVQAVSDACPSINTASNILSVGSMIATNSMSESMGDSLQQEQHSAMSSAQKTTQPGQNNGYNQKMAKSAGLNYQAIDFLESRNMTWTSQPPQGEELKRMGITTKNAPKTIGASALGGTAAFVGVTTAGQVGQAISSLLFEGGTGIEIPIREQVLQLRKRYIKSLEAPLTPTINSFIAMLYMKLLMSGIVNTQNNNLITWKNFGPHGILSVGDQVSIVLGNLFLIVALVLMLMISATMVYDFNWMFNFGKRAVGLENIVRRQGNHKWFMFSLGQLKTFWTVFLVIFFAMPSSSVPQMLIALVFNPANLLIVWNLKPLPQVGYLNLTKIVIACEVLGILTIYFQLMLTDVNPPPPSAKLIVGYFVLMFGQAKFYLNNIKQAGHDYALHKPKIHFILDKLKRTFCCCFLKKEFCEEEEKVPFSQRFFFMSRKQLTDSHRLNYRKKFQKLEKLEFMPKNWNKVAPIETFKPKTPPKVKPKNQNLFTVRSSMTSRFNPGVLIKYKKIEKAMLKPQLEVIHEQNEGKNKQ